jgi:hypothetical protein
MLNINTRAGCKLNGHLPRRHYEAAAWDLQGIYCIYANVAPHQCTGIKMSEDEHFVFF